MKKYGIKGTVFTIGHGVIDSDRDSIKKKQIKKLLKKYPTVEFQSHTYALHYRYSEKGDYKKVLKDAKKQSKYFSFEYVAYPFGRNTPGMRKAYKKAGIKMGFTYGSNGYATRKQNRYQIRRIKIDGNGTFSQFRRWFKVFLFCYFLFLLFFREEVLIFLCDFDCFVLSCISVNRG